MRDSRVSRSLTRWTGFTTGILGGPRPVVSSTLSGVLQAPEEVDPKYLLSPKAAAGILTRAHRRGRTLPEPLLGALTDLAGPTGWTVDPETGDPRVTAQGRVTGGQVEVDLFTLLAEEEAEAG